jgi:hypothetical protein
MPYNSLQLLLLIYTTCKSDISPYLSLKVSLHHTKHLKKLRFVTKHITSVSGRWYVELLNAIPSTVEVKKASNDVGEMIAFKEHDTTRPTRTTSLADKEKN